MENLYVNVWVGNLGKYNEGELVGEWFSLPCDIDEVAQVIGLNEEYEEYQINDYETNIEGLEIHHYTNLNTLNAFAGWLEELEEHEQLILKAYIDQYGTRELLSNYESIEFDNYHVHYDVKDMSDVAYNFMEESGQLAQVEKIMGNTFYIDFDSMGEDMAINGTFVFVDSNTCVEFLQ